MDAFKLALARRGSRASRGTQTITQLGKAAAAALSVALPYVGYGAAGRYSQRGIDSFNAAQSYKRRTQTAYLRYNRSRQYGRFSQQRRAAQRRRAVSSKKRWRKSYYGKGGTFWSAGRKRSGIINPHKIHFKTVSGCPKNPKSINCSC